MGTIENQNSVSIVRLELYFGTEIQSLFGFMLQ